MPPSCASRAPVPSAPGSPASRTRSPSSAWSCPARRRTPGRLLAALALLVGASLTVVTFAGVYRILLDSAGGLALLALLLGVTGSLGAAVHGGYDLAVALHPPSGDLGAAGELPHPIDPRGLLTFGVTGIGTLVVAWLIGRQPAFPRALGYLGYWPARCSSPSTWGGS